MPMKPMLSLPPSPDLETPDLDALASMILDYQLNEAKKSGEINSPSVRGSIAVNVDKLLSGGADSPVIIKIGNEKMVNGEHFMPLVGAATDAHKSRVVSEIFLLPYSVHLLMNCPSGETMEHEQVLSAYQQILSLLEMAKTQKWPIKTYATYAVSGAAFRVYFHSGSVERNCMATTRFSGQGPLHNKDNKSSKKSPLHSLDQLKRRFSIMASSGTFQGLEYSVDPDNPYVYKVEFNGVGLSNYGITHCVSTLVDLYDEFSGNVGLDQDLPYGMNPFAPFFVDALSYFVDTQNSKQLESVEAYCRKVAKNPNVRTREVLSTLQELCTK